MKKYHNDLGPGMDVVERALHYVDAQYDKGEADYSVTELTTPPQIRHLMNLHREEIVYDASGELFRLYGTIIHSLLEAAGTSCDEDRTEERLFAKITVDGIETTISGKFDHYSSERKSVEDYKLTSVWSFVWGLKPEWDFQINALAWLARENGYEVREGAIVAFYRDFQLKKAGDGKYPKKGAERVVVPLWKGGELAIDLSQHVREARQADAGHPLPCSDKERWISKGVPNRCKSYCAVAKWCPQFKGGK